MKSLLNLRQSFLCALIFVLSVTGLRAEKLIYEENFYNFSEQNAKAGTRGFPEWEAYLGKTAQPQRQTTVFLPPLGLSGNPYSEESSYLAVVPLEAENVDQYLVFTTLPDLYVRGATISWTMGNVSAEHRVHLMVQSQGQWYASKRGFTNNGYRPENFQTVDTSEVMQSLPYSWEPTDWVKIKLVPGEIVEAVPTKMYGPSYTITGIGFYIYNPNLKTGTVRIDSIKITQ